MPDHAAGDRQVDPDTSFILFKWHEELLAVCVCGGGA